MGQRWGTVILAGGRGTRMGNVDKGKLLYKGRPFRERIREQLCLLQYPCYLSVAAWGAGAQEETEWTVIEDTVKGEDGEGIGPMGGILSAFYAAKLDGIFCVSCDMPLFRESMARLLLARWKPGVDAVLWRTREGRIQPMCAFYSRTCLEALEVCVREKNYRMMNVLSQLNCVIVDTAGEHILDVWFSNINSPEAYSRLQSMKTPILAVSGRKDTGKTSLLEMIVNGLSQSGIRAAVIKHDGHDFEADVPGTDSYRMKQAGAYGTAVYSGSRFCLVKEQAGMEAGDFLQYFPEADVILLEGQKYSDYPKLEVMRREVSYQPVCSRDTVLAYVWSGEIGWEIHGGTEAVQGKGRRLPSGSLIYEGCPVYTASQQDEILEQVLAYMDQSTTHILT